jgi:Flp pilus assembly protein TadD
MGSFEQPQSRAEQAVETNRLQAEFEVEFFRRILERHPEHLEVLKRQARLLAAGSQRAEGLACDQQLVRLLPDDPDVHYHLACSLAAVGRLTEAVQSLLAAVELGYRDFDHLESDPDLQRLHALPQFQALLRSQGMA